MIRRSFKLLVAAGAVSLLLPTSPIAADGVDLVQLCHTRGEQAVNIEVGAPAVAAHLAHGDYLGECSEVDVCPFDAVAVTLTDSEPRMVPVQITTEGQDLNFDADDPPGVTWALTETDGTPVVGPYGADDHIHLLWFGFSQPGTYLMVFQSDLAGSDAYPAIDVSLSCTDVPLGSG